MQIAEYHCLDNDRGPPFIGKMHLMPIYPCLFGTPGGEDCKDRMLQLPVGIVYDLYAPLPHRLPVGEGNLFHLFRVELNLFRYRIAILVTAHDLIEDVSFKTMEHPPGLQKSPV